MSVCTPNKPWLKLFYCILSYSIMYYQLKINGKSWQTHQTTSSYFKAFVYDEIKHVWCGNKCTALQRQGNRTAKSEIIQESFGRASHVTRGIRRRQESKSCRRKRRECWFAGWKCWHKKWKHFRVPAQKPKEARYIAIKNAFLSLVELFLSQQ